MKKLVNVYSYTTTYICNGILVAKDSYLKAEYPKRSYATKLHKEDLPKNYCDVNRYNSWDGSFNNVINACGVKDLHYTWVKENHFMKDSTLQVSFTGSIEPIKTDDIWTDYTNVDEKVFGHSIFKYIAYVKHFSGIDISGVRDEFVKQCEWLYVNEPSFAPKLEKGETFYDWFNNTINELEKEIEK